MSNLQVYRSELKYLISQQECQLLTTRLKHVLPQNKYAKESEGYFVRSLYFDSCYDRSLREKKNGELIRKKYRMRIYDCAAQKIKFEIKHKRHGQVFKETAIISKETAHQVIQGNYNG